MATKASENKAAVAAENKTEEKAAADFLSQFEGAPMTLEGFEKAYPGRGEEIFRAVAKAGGYGEFFSPRLQQLGFPKKAANRTKINEAVAKLNLGAK